MTAALDRMTMTAELRRQPFSKKKSSGGPPLGNPGGITESNPASPVDDRFYLALGCSGLGFCPLAPAPHARLSLLHVTVDSGNLVRLVFLLFSL